MKKIICFILISIPFLSLAQEKFSAFKDFSFDSSYSIISIQTGLANINNDDQENCFLVKRLDEILSMQKDWTIQKRVPTLSFEAKSIDIFIMKDKQPIKSSLMIFPNQQIINYNNGWYFFDMQLFKKIQTSYPIQYYSRNFPFETYYEFVLFKDSMQQLHDVVMIMEPSAQKFEGSFKMILPRNTKDWNKLETEGRLRRELTDKFPKEKFDVSFAMNDPFNLEHDDKLLVNIRCSKNLYNQYQPTQTKKEDWEPFRFISKVVFLK